MHGYFNDVQFLNVARRRQCALSLAPYRHPDRASLELLRAGGMCYVVNGRAYDLRAPVVFWNVPGKTYAYRVAPGRSRDHSWADFAGARARRIGLALDRLEPKNFIPLADPDEFGMIFDEMIRVYLSDDPTAAFKIAVHLETLVGLVYDTCRNQILSETDQPAWHRLSLEIAEHPFRPWDFHEHARQAGVSYTHFRRRFRAAVGMAPHDYLLYCRARKAARELQTRDVSIKALAYEHGFSDPAILSRLIKSKLGVIPSSLGHLRQRGETNGRRNSLLRENQ